MVTFSEAQIMAWLTPMLWPFLRILALLAVAPVWSMRVMPRRIRIAMAFFITLCALPTLDAPAIALNSPQAAGAVAQQVMIGLTMGFAARVVFAALEFAGELIGLQMGLNFASFFDPTTGGQATVISRFFGTLAAWLFVVLNGHLLLTVAVIQSFKSFPVTGEPLAFLGVVQPQLWGTEIFRLGLWVALPVMAMLLLVNMVMGLMTRVAPQMNIFAIGFPMTISVGLVGLWLILPMMQEPFVVALERLLGYFQ